MSRTTDIGLVMVKESFTLSRHVQDVDQQDEVQSDVWRCSLPSWWLSDWKGFNFHSRRWCFGQFGFALARQGRSKMMHGDGVGPPFSKRGGVREGQEMNMYLWTQLDEMLPPGRSNRGWGQAQLFMDLNGHKWWCNNYVTTFLFVHVGMWWWVNMVEFSVLIGPVLVGLFILNDPTSMGLVLVLSHVHLTGTLLHGRISSSCWTCYDCLMFALYLNSCSIASYLISPFVWLTFLCVTLGIIGQWC